MKSPSILTWLLVAGSLMPGAGGCRSNGDASGSDAGFTSDAGLTSVAGAWCGVPVQTAADCVGDEVLFVELAQSGNVVTGQSCEAYQKGCYQILQGGLVGNQLTYSYVFITYQVDLDLVVSGPTELTGTIFSSKCSCTLPITLHKIP
jgi:hypothetical protein